jgi:hypothetical protein
MPMGMGWIDCLVEWLVRALRLRFSPGWPEGSSQTMKHSVLPYAFRVTFAFTDLDGDSVEVAYFESVVDSAW